MKKILFGASCLLIAGMSVFAKNTISINGSTYDIDTLVYKHNVGPGTKYAYYNVPDRPLTIHVMEVDLTNPYVDIETCLSGDSAVATERPTSMYARNDWPGHDMIGATNGDFYQYQNPIEIGIPRSGQFRRNECVTNPVGRASFVLTPDRVPYIDRVDFRGTLTKGETSTRIHAVNMQRLEWENTGGDFMLLYTNSYGKYTHKTSGGVKAIIRPKEGDLFFSANKTIECVVESVFDNPGISPIPENAAVLYGVGASETYLRTLQAGDEIGIFLKTDLRSQPGLLTDFKEQMGGSDDIVLQGGITDAGQSGAATGEHPRTGMGISKDKKTVYIVVVDGRQTASAGVSLQDFGEVFKTLGAWDAVNLDGGGSTCMVVNKEIRNHPSDGNERAVGNGVLVLSNAPVDDVIASIEFSPRSYNVPANARFRPIIYAFNQYGLMKSDDLEGVEFSCSPEIGEFNENKEFTAVDGNASGYITATYGDVSVTQAVNVVNSPITLERDSYLIDNSHPCEIKMNATVGLVTDAVDPASAKWEVENPEICEVRDGVIYALKDGTTKITGTLSNFSGEITVTVENPQASAMPVFSEIVPGDWSLMQSGGSGLTLTPDGDGFVLSYAGASSRAPYIQASHSAQIWGLPDKIRARLNVGEAPVKSLQLSVSNALGESLTNWILTGEIKANEEFILEGAFSEWCDPLSVYTYPISVNNLRFNMGTSTKGQQYEIRVLGLDAIYDGYDAVTSVEADNNRVRIWPNPVAGGETVRVEADGKATVMVYGMNGAMVAETTIDGVGEISTAGLAQGVYIVKVMADSNVKTAKLIVK